MNVRELIDQLTNLGMDDAEVLTSDTECGQGPCTVNVQESSGNTLGVYTPTGQHVVVIW